MGEIAVLSAAVRNDRGSRAARRLRAAGKLPAVLYGHNQDNVVLTVDNEQVAGLLRHGAHGLLEIDVNGVKESAVIKDLQWDPLGKELLHIDFTRVSRDETVTIEVPVVIRGTAPGIAEGGVLDHSLHSIEIECPAVDIQEQVVVNVNQLHLGQAILVRDLALRPNIRATADPEAIVVQVVTPQEEVEEEKVETAAAEPELIRRESRGEEGAE